MLLKQFKTHFLNELSSLYDESEIDSFFYIIIEKLHYLKRIDLALNPETVMDGTHLKKWNSIISDLKTQKPIQYILGETEFYDLRFEEQNQGRYRSSARPERRCLRKHQDYLQGRGSVR